MCSLLEGEGEKCFIAPRDIRMGFEYAEEIINGIDHARVMVVLMSEDANQSPHVLREVERAVSKRIPILVYKMEDVNLSKSMEYFLMAHQWLNADTDQSMKKILEFVREMKIQESGVLKEKAVEKEVKSKDEAEKKHGRIKKKGLSKGVAAGIAAAIILLLVIAGFFIKNYSAKNRVAVGDTVTFGEYNDEAIEWRVLRISEDGEQAVLISKDILTMKAFDTAESGEFNSDGTNDYWSGNPAIDTDMEIQILARGNSDWSTSNIRTWLNSPDEVVTYADQAPEATAMAEKKNGYNNESGFLYHFTEKELEAIVPTENVTATNALSEETEVVTTDLVYLLSVDELAWFDEAGISKLASPTEAAIVQDKTNWYFVDKEIYELEEFRWWLRTPVSDSSCMCYMVGNGFHKENVLEEMVGLEGYGIRPAITVDLSSDAIQIETE